MSHKEESDSSSVRKTSARPGRISGVAAWVMKTWAVGVAEGGNHAKVGEGSGVSVGTAGIGVASMESNAEHPVIAIVIAREQSDRSNPRLALRLLRRHFVAPRNDVSDMIK